MRDARDHDAWDYDLASDGSLTPGRIHGDWLTVIVIYNKKYTFSPHIHFSFSVLCFVNGTTCSHCPNQRPGSHSSLFAPPHPGSLTSNQYQGLSIPSLESIYFSPLAAISLVQVKIIIAQLWEVSQLVLELFQSILYVALRDLSDMYI